MVVLVVEVVAHLPDDAPAVGQPQPQRADHLLLVVGHAQLRIELGVGIAELGEQRAIGHVKRGILAAQRPVVLVEAGLRDQVEARERRQVEARNIVRAVRLQPVQRVVVGHAGGIDAGIEGERVLPRQVQALAKDDAAEEAGGGLEGVLHADVEAGAGLEPVVAREPVGIEQQSVVEDQASGVLVRQLALIPTLPGRTMICAVGSITWVAVLVWATKG